MIDRLPAILAAYTINGAWLGRLEAETGSLEVGKAADLVVFDPQTIIDRSTYEEPNRGPEGIDYVFVNGRLAAEKNVGLALDAFERHTLVEDLGGGWLLIAEHADGPTRQVEVEIGPLPRPTPPQDDGPSRDAPLILVFRQVEQLARGIEQECLLDAVGAAQGFV